MIKILRVFFILNEYPRSFDKGEIIQKGISNVIHIGTRKTVLFGYSEKQENNFV